MLFISLCSGQITHQPPPAFDMRSVLIDMLINQIAFWHDSCSPGSVFILEKEVVGE